MCVYFCNKPTWDGACNGGAETQLKSRRWTSDCYVDVTRQGACPITTVFCCTAARLWRVLPLSSDPYSWCALFSAGPKHDRTENVHTGTRVERNSAELGAIRLTK
ncbi:hypothetical protein ElyMa_006063500 [Elysia marginata]|uniref:Uncharacterized protein n=1 Tax=Elysia marginata TaxID=1093978 RepID=A0AAV4GP73_9GAST|nr:hypothetical protein ElyMa_006063500 [Elysia marginata]